MPGNRTGQRANVNDVAVDVRDLSHSPDAARPDQDPVALDDQPGLGGPIQQAPGQARVVLAVQVDV